MPSPSQDWPLEIDVHAVRSLLDENQDFLLLDCREPTEHSLVNIQYSGAEPLESERSRTSSPIDSRQGTSVCGL